MLRAAKCSGSQGDLPGKLCLGKVGGGGLRPPMIPSGSRYRLSVQGGAEEDQAWGMVGPTVAAAAPGWVRAEAWVESALRGFSSR